MEDTNAPAASPSSPSNANNLARWFGTSVVAAFFVSLERCACVNVDADGEEDDDEANDDPLLITTFYSFNSNGAAQGGDGSNFASASQNVIA
ncbi:hypothetical protein AAHA92_07711 [Salvia divinorum]|uniref:Uncharacterized protein n=1 Tax=Salvia divinorum TaxID=28513 RepID=A0ABD1I9V9_SALDI